jgi:hypothetical protein
MRRTPHRSQSHIHPGFFKHHRSTRLERVLKTLAFKRRYKP